MADEWVVEWPTLGFLGADWIEHHCIVPDGFRKGEPFALYRWQLWCTCNHYRVRPDALPAGSTTDDGSLVSVASAFHYRRSLVVGPQKCGKGPWAAATFALEAVGPVVFAGWAKAGDVYRCSDWDCPCGWEWPYEEGDPLGRPWPNSLIQLTATAADQVDNVYRPLKAMARATRLAPLMQVTEEAIHLPNAGEISVVTSSARSRLGQPVTAVLHDESGLYTATNGMKETADTQRRGVSGMGGRAIETTNAWDPAQESTAQDTAEAAEVTGDIFIYHRQPPKELGKYTDPVARRKIHEFAYADSPHVDLNVIEAEAAELIAKGDVNQAERFYGNRIVSGDNKWMTPEEWDAHPFTGAPPAKREKICLGFDGSAGTGSRRRRADSTVLVASRLSDGHCWAVGAWEQPLDAEIWEVPRHEVDMAVAQAFRDHEVILFGVDPPYWRDELAKWIEEFGDDVVLPFETRHDLLMARALEGLKTGIATGEVTHDGSDVMRRHALNAVAFTKEVRDDVNERKRIVLITKASKDSPDKIDCTISMAIANDMRTRAITAGARKKKKYKAVSFR